MQINLIPRCCCLCSFRFFCSCCKHHPTTASYSIGVERKETWERAGGEGWRWRCCHDKTFESFFCFAIIQILKFKRLFSLFSSNDSPRSFVRACVKFFVFDALKTPRDSSKNHLSFFLSLYICVLISTFYSFFLSSSVPPAPVCSLSKIFPIDH